MSIKKCKKCKTCEEVKDISDFYRAGEYWQSTCKQCQNSARIKSLKKNYVLKSSGFYRLPEAKRHEISKALDEKISTQKIYDKYLIDSILDPSLPSFTYGCLNKWKLGGQIPPPPPPSVAIS